MCLTRHALPLRSSPARDEGTTGAFCSCGIYRKRTSRQAHTTPNRRLGRQTKALSVRKPQLEPETRRQITAQHRANTLITRPKYYLFSMFPIFFSSIEIMPFGMLTNSMKSGL